MYTNIEFDIFGSEQQSRSKQLSYEKSVNLVTFTTKEGKKSFANSCGFTKLNDFSGTGNIVAIKSSNRLNLLYAVIGTEAGVIDTDYNFDSYGSIGSANQAQIIEDPNNVYFSEFETLSYKPNSSALASVLMANLPPSKSFQIEYLDGFLITFSINTSTFFLSALNDGTNWKWGAGSSFVFANLTSEPDIIQAIVVINRRLIIFGNNVTEIWYNAGYPDFPLRRDNSIVINIGIFNQNTFAKLEDSVFFIGKTRLGALSVFVTDGGQPREISTSSISYYLNNVVTPNDWLNARCFAYRENSHIFFVIYTASVSLGYDLSTDTWHERTFLGYTPMNFVDAEFFNNSIIATRYQSGLLSSISMFIYSHDGENIPYLRITKEMASPDFYKVILNRIRLDFYSLTMDPNLNDNYKIRLSISEDSGYTFSNEQEQIIPKYGDFIKKIIWRLLGTKRKAVFKFEFFLNQEFYILGMFIRLDKATRD